MKTASLAWVSLAIALSPPHTSTRAEEAGIYYDENDLIGGQEFSDEESRVLADIAGIYAEIEAIRGRGNSKEEVTEHRAYRLIPALREVARKAGDLSSRLLLSKSLELASCESDPSLSYEWTDILSKNANKFGESDFQAAVESLPDANKRSLKVAMSANLPDSFKWKGVLRKIPMEDDGLETGFDPEEQP